MDVPVEPGVIVSTSHRWTLTYQTLASVDLVQKRLSVGTPLSQRNNMFTKAIRATVNPIHSIVRTSRNLLVVSIIALSGVVGIIPAGDTAAASPPSRTVVTATDMSYVIQNARVTTSKRVIALAWAKTQRGKWYVWGGIGPNGYDCSGIVYAAYNRVGLHFGRNTTGMLYSGRIARTGHPRPGDLAFFGTGHVELYISGGLYNGVTFGFHHTGTRGGYRSYNSYYHPSAFYHVDGAN